MSIKELQVITAYFRDNDPMIFGVKGGSKRTIEFPIYKACLSNAKSQLLIQWSLSEWLLIELID